MNILLKGDLVVINFEQTPFEGNDFITPIGLIEQVLNDATKETSYLVNNFWFNESNLEKIW